MTTSNKSFRAVPNAFSLADVFGHDIFVVPPNQREFAWTEKEVGQLWDDIWQAYETKEPDYLLGTIALVHIERTSGGHKYEIQDGQQRMTVCSMMVGALLPRLSEESYQIAHDVIYTDRTIGPRASSNGSSPRIRLQDVDDTNYRGVVANDVIDSAKSLIGECQRVLRERIDEIENDDIEQFFAYITERVYFIHCSTEEHGDWSLGAWTFERQNNRGKRMSEVDSLFGYFHARATEQGGDNIWDPVKDSLGEVRSHMRGHKGRQTKLGQYVRCILECRYGTDMSPKTLHDDAINNIRKETTKTLLEIDVILAVVLELRDKDNMRAFDIVYDADRNCDEVKDFISRSGKSYHRHHMADYIREFKNYRGVSIPITFAVLSTFLHADSSKRSNIAKRGHDVIQTLNALVMRRIVAGDEFKPSAFFGASDSDVPNDGVVHWGHLIWKDDVGEESTQYVISRIWKHKYVDNDKTFDDDQFKERAVRIGGVSNKPRKDILISIYKHGGSELDMESLNVEHVFPQSPIFWAGWSFEERIRGLYVNVLGNLTLMMRDKNKGTDEYNGSFENKRSTFESSDMRDNRRIAEFHEWNEDAVSKRQGEMVASACEVWRPCARP